MSYDCCAELVPAIREQGQAGWTEKIGEQAREFDSLSDDPFPTSRNQPWLRSDWKAPRDELTASLAMTVLADEHEQVATEKTKPWRLTVSEAMPGLDGGTQTVMGAGGLDVIRKAGRDMRTMRRESAKGSRSHQCQ